MEWRSSVEVEGAAGLGAVGAFCRLLVAGQAEVCAPGRVESHCCDGLCGEREVKDESESGEDSQVVVWRVKVEKYLCNGVESSRAAMEDECLWLRKTKRDVAEGYETRRLVDHDMGAEGVRRRNALCKACSRQGSRRVGRKAEEACAGGARQRREHGLPL